MRIAYITLLCCLAIPSNAELLWIKSQKSMVREEFLYWLHFTAKSRSAAGQVSCGSNIPRARFSSERRRSPLRTLSLTSSSDDSPSSLLSLLAGVTC